MQHNYEKMRKVVLSEGYDKVWIVESDTIPPEDALEKLLEIQAPVVTGLYMLRHGTPGSNLFRYEEDRQLFAGRMGNNMRAEEVKKNWGRTLQVSGGCMGCLVLDRSVVEGFSFMRKDEAAPDMGLMEYCCREEIKQMARLDVGSQETGWGYYLA
jgi:hypothetical protein